MDSFESQRLLRQMLVTFTKSLVYISSVTSRSDSLCEPTAPRLYPEVPKTPEPVRIVPVMLPQEDPLPYEPVQVSTYDLLRQEVSRHSGRRLVATVAGG